MDFFKNNRSIEIATKIYESRINDARIIYNMFSNNFIYRNCPFCDYQEYSIETKFIDLYDIAKCNRCNSLYVNPCPNNDAIDYYYNNCECNKLLDSLFRKRSEDNNDFINDTRIVETLKLINVINKEGINILEIGCGSGNFLNKLYNVLNDNNINLYGVDIDNNAISKNTNKNINLIVGDAENININIKFDIILNFELIEHLINPNGFINNANKLLNNDGYCIITTPNSLGLEIKAIHYNKFRLLAHSIFPPMHLNAFNTQNIGHFFIKNNFKIIDIKTPGKLDLSMLLNSIGEFDDIELKKIKNVDESLYQTIQYLISYLNGSSHMLCVIKK